MDYFHTQSASVPKYFRCFTRPTFYSLSHTSHLLSQFSFSVVVAAMRENTWLFTWADMSAKSNDGKRKCSWEPNYDRYWFFVLFSWRAFLVFVCVRANVYVCCVWVSISHDFLLSFGLPRRITISVRSKSIWCCYFAHDSSIQLISDYSRTPNQSMLCNNLCKNFEKFIIYGFD